jgi:hypothetical protein
MQLMVSVLVVAAGSCFAAAPFFEADFFLAGCSPDFVAPWPAFLPSAAFGDDPFARARTAPR